MSQKKDENNLSFAEKACFAFNEIMANNHKDMLEDMNRANRGELFVLHFLAVHDIQVLPSELSAALQVSTARISALLGSLEKKGQIRRDIDKDNRRNILVTITDSGRERAKEEMDKMKKNVTKVFLEMGETDTEEFIRLLKRFFELSHKHKCCCRKRQEDEKN